MTLILESTIFRLALLGGLLSLLATALGSVVTPLFDRSEGLQRVRLSIDFALGTMLSATAFSLVGPQLNEAIGDPHLVLMVLGGFAGGIIFIGLTNRLIESRQEAAGRPVGETTRLILALALIFHNLPEGMGAGAALAGMELRAAVPLHLALAVQNIAEGILLTLCLRALGWQWSTSAMGGIGSGLVEFSGAAIAGVALDRTLQSLPFLLSLAGGAMLMSVMIELKETLQSGRALKTRQILAGFLTVPTLHLLLILGSSR